uniref:Uncharacterized protein n=1 Tax=Oryza barthii TaxID=65489 RepID=A0A0D3GXI5_9ORYZ
MTKVRWRSTNGIMCLSTGQPSPPSRHYPICSTRNRRRRLGCSSVAPLSNPFSSTPANSDGRPQRPIQSRPSSHPSLHEDGGDGDKPFKAEDWHQGGSNAAWRGGEGGTGRRRHRPEEELRRTYSGEDGVVLDPEKQRCEGLLGVRSRGAMRVMEAEEDDAVLPRSAAPTDAVKRGLSEACSEWAGRRGLI